MFSFRRLRHVVAAGFLGIAAGFLGGTSARAGGYGDYCQPACHYAYVTEYVPRTTTYTTYVTRYDHCGRPYRVAKVCYRTVQVPVSKRVLVCDVNSPSGY